MELRQVSYLSGLHLFAHLAWEDSLECEYVNGQAHDEEANLACFHLSPAGDELFLS